MYDKKKTEQCQPFCEKKVKVQGRPAHGDRAGQHSIRINQQWRICFVWLNDAYDVEIVDYH